MKKYAMSSLVAALGISVGLSFSSVSLASDPHPKSVTKAEHSSAPLLNLGGEASRPEPTHAPKKVTHKPVYKSTPMVRAKPATDHGSKKHAKPHWRYSGKDGPSHWGDLHASYSACKGSKNQSPIDLRDSTAVGTTRLSGFDVHYRDVPMRIHNNGHTIQVNYPRGSYIMIGKSRYDLLQFHFHTPSEHTKNGFNYPMEMHLVHQNADGELAVIGIVFEEGKMNLDLEDMFDYLPTQINKPKLYKDIVINPTHFFPKNKVFFKYSGSLTTPPCSEGVYWMVFRDTVNISPQQVDLMQRILGNNARPIQEPYARTLLKSYADRESREPLYGIY